MARCNFCKETYKSEQSVKAHMKRCVQYLTEKSKKETPSGTVPEAASTPAAQPSPSAGPGSVAPLHAFEKAMHDFSPKQEAPQTPQQLRRSILQAVKAQVVDRYQSSAGTVTSAMRGDAKRLIEQQLASLPLEELPFDEACQLAAAIRDRLYVPIIKRKAQEAAQQQAEQESRRRKQIEDMAAEHRAAGRKATLIEQAISQARARCEAQQIVGWNRLGVLVDIESRLNELLTSGEPVPAAQVIIQCVIEARFIEAAAKQEAAQAKATARWYEEITGVVILGAFLAAPLLAAWYPTQALVISSWLERTFGRKPGAEAAAPTPEASAPTPPAASAESRPASKRRRKYPVAAPGPESPWSPSAGPAQGHA